MERIEGDARAGFVPGEYEMPVEGERHPVERKSPALRDVQPHRDRNLTVDAARYTSREWAELEWQRLWPKVWLCAGRLSDIPRKGCWLQFEFGVESILVVRGEGDAVHALLNVCQHRGHQLVSGDFGEGSQFVCGYHSWRYGLDGRNRHVTDRRFFREEALCGKLDMPSLRCETWGGFVFVNFDNDAIPLSEYLGEIADVLADYRIEDMAVVNDVVVQLECNWKTVLDAFSEAYHVHVTHPELMEAIEDKYLQHDFYAHGHSRQWVPNGIPSARLGEARLTEPLKYLLAEAGLDPSDFADRPGDVRPALREVKRRRDNPWGLDYSRFTDSQLTDSWAMNLFPNLQIIVQPEGVLFQRYIPDRNDPQKCRQHIMALAPRLGPGVRPPAYLGGSDVPDPDNRPERIRTSWDAPDLIDTIGLLLWQDVDTTRRCQRGMQSVGFDRVRFSEQETRNLHQFAEMDRYLFDEF